MAVQRGRLSAKTAAEMVSHLKRIYFPSRSYFELARAFPGHKQFLLSPQPDLKAIDATLMLEKMATLQSHQDPLADTDALTQD
jgi:hypothetical protein